MHVFDNTDYYFENPGKIFAVWQGGIGFLGAMIGGILAGGIFAKIKPTSFIIKSSFARYPTIDEYTYALKTALPPTFSLSTIILL